MENFKILNFYDLDTWKKAHELVIEIYKVTKQFPRDELYGVVSQLKRAASSVTANIAEGFERYHFKDKIKFYYQARGSLAEVQSFIILAKDLDFVNIKVCKDIIDKADEVRKLINGLIRSIEKQI